MDNDRIYEDIALRTEGDIYIGVVGPVRTGKSTFIKRFMETLVIPNIDNVYRRERAKDELPQSGSGKTIMTAEPKFVPEEAVELNLGPASFKVRLIDCVGYMVNGALGQYENGEPRMVTTPWFDHEIPMAEAAETGTRKVIAEHSTIGLVVTTDGSITDIPREDYIEAEERVIGELKAIGKPFLVLVNSIAPQSDEAQALRQAISSRHNVTCIAVDCLSLNEAGVADIIKGVLYEFPVKELNIYMPAWAGALPPAHWLKSELHAAVLDAAKGAKRIRDAEGAVAGLKACGHIASSAVESMSLGDGTVNVRLDIPRSLFYEIISAQSGFDIKDDRDLIPLLEDLGRAKSSFDKVSAALASVRDRGYGIVMPSIEELRLEEPEIVRQGGRFGVRLKASAPSIHMIRADIETEVSPVVGSEKQSEDLVNYLLKEFEGETAKIWESNIFGKSLHELVNEGLTSKLNHMPEDAQAKLRETLQRIINEGSGGLICIIL